MYDKTQFTIKLNYIVKTQITAISQLLIQLRIYNTFKIEIHSSFVYMLL